MYEYNAELLIYNFLVLKFLLARQTLGVIIVVTSFSVLIFYNLVSLLNIIPAQYLMIISSGKLFRINKSLPTSVCNQGHQAMKGIELYSYDLQSNTGTSLIYIMYHHTLYFVTLIITINIHLLSYSSPPSLFFCNFLNIWEDVRPGQASQFRDHQDLVINDQYDNIKDVCCDVSYQL